MLWFVRLRSLEMAGSGTTSATLPSPHKLEGWLLNLEVNVCCLALDLKLEGTR